MKVSKKKIVWAALLTMVFFIIVVAGVGLIFYFIPIGPGLPPPEIMSKWYIPGELKGNEKPCTLQFPNISHYCSVENVSGGKFISVWYFDDKSEFFKRRRHPL